MYHTLKELPAAVLMLSVLLADAPISWYTFHADNDLIPQKTYLGIRYQESSSLLAFSTPPFSLPFLGLQSWPASNG